MVAVAQSVEYLQNSAEVPLCWQLIYLPSPIYSWDTFQHPPHDPQKGFNGQTSTVELYLFLQLWEKKFGSVRDIKMKIQIHLGDLLFLFSQKLCHTFDP